MSFRAKLVIWGMEIQEQIDYWFDLADEDMIVAESNFNNRHFLWCLFLCHLALEKTLKVLFVHFAL